jgi:hypothetical protein
MRYKYNSSNKIVEAEDGNKIWSWNYENDLLTHHKSPSIEWTKEYDERGREIKYTCGNRVVNTWYDEEGNKFDDDEKPSEFCESYDECENIKKEK